MKEMRIMGSFIQKLIKENNVKIYDLCEILNIELFKFEKFLQGRLFLSFKQLELLAYYFNISVEDIMNGDENYYNKTVVHENGSFEDYDNREEILDIIDDYIMLKESINK